jgi:hypothetical protein
MLNAALDAVDEADESEREAAVIDPPTEAEAA